MHFPSQNDAIVDIDVEEDLNERIIGGNSDGDCDYAREFGGTMREVELERWHVMLWDYGIEKYNEGEMISVLIHVGENMDQDEAKVPKPPYHWVEPSTNT